MLTQRLVRVTVLHGGYEGKFPARACFVHPDVVPAWSAVNNSVVVTDMNRTAESSLHAMAVKRGVQPPGFSGHGLPSNCIDIDVDATMKLMQDKTKADLDARMLALGWQCFRFKHLRGSEDWHYGALLGPLIQTTDINSAHAQERLLQHYYGAELRPDDSECQRLLAKLGLYHGEIDGKLGPISAQAIGAFQRAWLVANYAPMKGVVDYREGVADAVTRRVLAFVAADRQIS